MSGLAWYELHIPRGLDLDAVTAAMRPLASRRRDGAFGQTPVVTFELWRMAGTTRWLLGIDFQVSGSVRQQMTAALPQLGIVEVGGSLRPDLWRAADVRMEGLASPLRFDLAPSISAALLAVLAELGVNEAAVVQWVVGPAHTHPGEPATFNIAESLGLRSARQPDPGQQTRWRGKLTEPLYGVHGRIAAVAGSDERARAIIGRLYAALALANSAHARFHRGPVTGRAARAATEVYRPRSTWSCILNACELASVLGWPLDGVPQAEALAMGGYRRPVPPSLLVASDAEAVQRGARVLGASLHPADGGRLATVPVETSLRHLHVIGPTGSGKSTLLADLVLSDIAAGHAVFLAEPKGDLVADLLARMPSSRYADVTVIDPADSAYPVGLNVLAGPVAEAERRADQVLHLLHELNAGSWGPRSADVILHALLTICRLPDGTFADLPVLLGQPAFRRQVLGRVNDPLVLGPFWSWYDGLSEAERSQVISPVLNKIRSFLSRQSIRRMLGQPRPRFDLDELFSGRRRRIVLVNLNRGLLGPEASSLLGALLLTQAWQAIQRRAAMPAQARHPVMMVIDEFQDYLKLPLDFGEVLAQARGLGVSLTVAHQHLKQLPAELRASVLANARSRVAFRPADDDLKPLAAVLGIGPEDLAALGAYQACGRLVVDGALTPVFGVATRPLRPISSDADALRALSRSRYGADGQAVDDALLARWEQSPPPPAGPIGVRRRRPS